MPLLELNSASFENFVEKNQLVFVDFWASWCAPCKQFEVIYEKVAKENPTLQFVKINIEKEEQLANRLEIRSIPHLMIFKEGIAIYSEAGSMPESILKELVEQAKEADLSVIRSEIEKDREGKD